MMVPRIAIEPMPAAAGQFEVDEEGWVTIRVSPDFERDLPAARAILAHSELFPQSLFPKRVNLWHIARQLPQYRGVE